MTLRNHLVIFAKAPRLGLVKSRLAVDIGWVAATGFYRRTLADVLRRLAADRRWRTWLAITPDRDARNPRRWPARCRLLPQGPGDLGRRLMRPLRRLPPGPVVIVGSDIPDLCPRHVARAFRALGTAACVFGPSDDGGYWLVGVRRRPSLPALFRAVRWSTPHALADTLRDAGDAVLLETLPDIDDGAGLARWRATRRGQSGSPFKSAR